MWGSIFKVRGRKIQILRKEIQSPGKGNPKFFLPRIGTFQRVAPPLTPFPENSPTLLNI
jgi:hypothetical protein